MTEKSIKKESDKIKKIYAVVKKAISKEFLWILLTLLISIPLSLVFSYLVSVEAEILEKQLASELKEISEIITLDQPMFRVVFGICFLGIYFSRMVVAAIKTQLGDKK